MSELSYNRFRVYYRAVFDKNNKFVGLECANTPSKLKGERKDGNKFSGWIWSELRFKR